MADAEAEPPPGSSQMPVASAAGMIADNAARFLSNSSGSDVKSNVSSASLGSLVELNFDKLQGTISFLVESVRVLAGAAQKAAEPSAPKSLLYMLFVFNVLGKRWLVFGCIGTAFCKYIRALQHFFEIYKII